MNTILMNSENSKTSDLHRLYLTDKIDLRRKDKYIALLNLSIHYTWKYIKKPYKSNNIKYQLQHGMKNLNYLTDHFLYQKLKIILTIY